MRVMMCIDQAGYHQPVLPVNDLFNAKRSRREILPKSSDSVFFDNNIVSLQQAFLIIQGQFNSITDKLFEGNKTIVRYTREGIVNGFGSELIGVIATPVELAFIKAV